MKIRFNWFDRSFHVNHYTFLFFPHFPGLHITCQIPPHLYDTFESIRDSPVYSSVFDSLLRSVITRTPPLFFNQNAIDQYLPPSQYKTLPSISFSPNTHPDNFYSHLEHIIYSVIHNFNIERYGRIKIYCNDKTWMKLHEIHLNTGHTLYEKISLYFMVDMIYSFHSHETDGLYFSHVSSSFFEDHRDFPIDIPWVYYLPIQFELTMEECRFIKMKIQQKELKNEFTKIPGTDFVY